VATDFVVVGNTPIAVQLHSTFHNLSPLTADVVSTIWGVKRMIVIIANRRSPATGPQIAVPKSALPAVPNVLQTGEENQEARRRFHTTSWEHGHERVAIPVRRVTARRGPSRRFDTIFQMLIGARPFRVALDSSRSELLPRA